jgi:hypothetical protein
MNSVLSLTLELFVIQEFMSTNTKVKREATFLVGILHKQLGPALRSLFLSITKQQSVKEQLQKCFDENAYDSSIQSAGVWCKKTLFGGVTTTNSSSDGRKQQNGALEIPKIDFMLVLAKDILPRLVSFIKNIMILFLSTGHSSLN